MSNLRSIGPHNAKLMIIGECANSQDIIENIPFSGRPGDLLDKILDTAGIPSDSVYKTYLVKSCPQNDKERKVEIESRHNRALLWDEIVNISPVVIICFGQNITNILLKKKSILKYYAGTISCVDYHTARICPLWALSYILSHGKEEMDIAVNTFKRIYKMIQWEENL